jgi:hypothetical protein
MRNSFPMPPIVATEAGAVHPVPPPNKYFMSRESRRHPSQIDPAQSVVDGGYLPPGCRAGGGTVTLIRLPSWKFLKTVACMHSFKHGTL